MLTNITIKNYVIIESLELEFFEGLTALTGETGAGKSILLGALGLVLGDRADNDTIKHGSDYAEIVAEFDISSLPHVIEWLKDQDLDTTDSEIIECNLRRRISKDGRSRAHINGTPVNLSLLRDLSEMLIDIHGQHEHQSLMKPQAQRQLLDDYANHPKLLEDIRKTHIELVSTQTQLQEIETSSAERTDKLELLNFQIDELNALAIEENEYKSLSEKHKRLANSEKLINTTRSALDVLQENENFTIQSELSQIISSLQDSNEIDEKLTTTVNLLSEAQIQIEEGISELNSYASNLDSDPNELLSIESRLQSILDISRKHHIEPESLDEFHQKLIKELNDIGHADERLEELRQTVRQLEEQYFTLSKSLFKKRSDAATQLNKKITAAMQTLGMKGGKFEANVTHQEKIISNHGGDKIEFNVSANAGSNCKPLNKVASGGELARISLAIQMITTSQSKIHTLIFDEVDSGVGGGIAEIVGKQLRILGSSNQVMCITHLPQVASQAHNHMKVHKISEEKTTKTYVDPLSAEQRIEEVARMLSGVDITKQSLANAEDMISRASA